MIVTMERPVSDDEAVLAGFHDDRLRHLLALPDAAARGEAATRYITWLDQCRVDATAVRDVAVHQLHKDQKLGALRIANLLGVGKARGQQLIYRSAETHVAATQIVAKIKRRVGKG